MQTIDLIVFLVITGGIVLLGASFWRRKTSSDDFTAAGGNLPGWVVGMSIFTTYVSSISFLGYPARSFSSDWNAFVFSLSIPVASFLAARYFVPFYRKQASISAYTFLEKRFGRWARWYASACYLLTQVARVGSIMFLMALPMNVLMGWDIHTIIIVTSLAVILYSVLGGVKGVVWTETIQGFVIIGGALICLFMLLFNMPEGPAQVFTIAWDSNKFSLGSFSITDLNESTFWVCLIYGIFINLQNFGIDQSYVQRYHVARTERAARFSVLFSSYLFIPMSAVFLLIGTALYSYYSIFPAMLPDVASDDYIFPFFIVNQLPQGFTGFLIACIFAAGMSTVATSINSSSTVILNDYYRRLYPHDNDRRHMMVLKVSGVIVGLVGIIVSLALVQVDNILDAWWKLSSVFSGGMLGLFLLGFLGQRVGKIDAAIGVICGVIVIGWISAYKWLGLPNLWLHDYLAIVLGTIVIFLVGFLLGRWRFRKAV